MALVRTTVELEELLIKKLKVIALMKDIPLKVVVTLGLEAAVINWENKNGKITISKKQLKITENGGS